MTKIKEPVINTNDKVVSFDVDDTLVMWDADCNQPGEGKIAVLDPYQSAGYGEVPIYIYLTPHEKHIQKLKGYARSGFYIIIWSMGGGEWARNVADALKLTEYCDLISGKPVYLYDDMPLNEAFGERKYFQPKKAGDKDE